VRAPAPLPPSLVITGVELSSVLRCPACGHADTLAMPTDACLFFHECAGCHTLLRPKSGDCCVFCSYGSVPCPPIQAGSACGSTDDPSAHESAPAADAAGRCRAAGRPEVSASGSPAAGVDA
jgi:Zn ribbon nucleic-acid-binding protein